jgi:hypothetical protein
MASKNIGCLWQRKDKNGKTYFSGIIERQPFGEDINFAVFKVDEKKSDRAPDWRIVWSPREDVRPSARSGEIDIFSNEEKKDDEINLDELNF